MGYVAVSGGSEAIEASIRLLEYYRSGTEKSLELDAIEKSLSLLVDRVMSEAGLFASTYAALALKQCEGSLEEAVFLLRAYRSTLPRNYYSLPADTASMRVIRRISSAFKDIQGGQILGPTYDYTHRLINFGVENEDAALRHQETRQQLLGELPEPVSACPRVSDSLKQEGLIDASCENNAKPCDITEKPLEFPAPRSARLQTLARADTGFMSGLAYAALRGFGMAHPTVGELRCGYVELSVPYLFDDSQCLYIGEVLLTEAEILTDADDTDKLKLAIGYGVAFGRNDTKAISMAILDRELECGGPYPPQQEEFVLMHGDSLEMNGFISHLKLPHYVTFQSKLDAVRKTR